MGDIKSISDASPMELWAWTGCVGVISLRVVTCENAILILFQASIELSIQDCARRIILRWEVGGEAAGFKLPGAAKITAVQCKLPQTGFSKQSKQLASSYSYNSQVCSLLSWPFSLFCSTS